MLGVLQYLNMPSMENSNLLKEWKGSKKATWWCRFFKMLHVLPDKWICQQKWRQTFWGTSSTSLIKKTIWSSGTWLKMNGEQFFVWDDTGSCSGPDCCNRTGQRGGTEIVDGKCSLVAQYVSIEVLCQGHWQI